ncbi:MAG: hypothetical protein M3297_09365 [Thermoproteota archaeon]|nr:hypothetical protein [Thermoproteota archaeon]
MMETTSSCSVIKQRNALILIPTILSLVSGMVNSAPHEAFAQSANTITGSGSSMITQEQAIQVAITNSLFRLQTSGKLNFTMKMTEQCIKSI